MRPASLHAQVYKALRGGVQDVAVKFLHRTSDEDLNRFVEVLRPHRVSCCCQRQSQLTTRPQ
jgi:hypothetical protein